MARANSIITTTHSAADGTLVFNVKGAGSLTLNLADVHADVLQRAAIHGLTQRISDAAAIPCDPETGKPATPEEKYASMVKLVDHYNAGSGEWNRARVEGGEPREAGGFTLKAIAAVYGIDVATAKTKVEALALSKKVEYKVMIKSLAASKTVMDKVAELKAAAFKPSVDAEELLTELA